MKLFDRILFTAVAIAAVVLACRILLLALSCVVAPWIDLGIKIQSAREVEPDE